MIDRSLRYWLLAESGAELIFWTACYAHLGAGWLVFGICFLLPDLSILGYLKDSRWGTVCYNAAHSYIAPPLLGLLALGHSSLALSAAQIRAAHIAFDRALGYGMKETSGFNQTHLGTFGRARRAIPLV